MRQRRIASGRHRVVEARKDRIEAIRRQAEAVRQAAVEMIVDTPPNRPDARVPALAQAAMLLAGARQMEEDAAALERTFT
jgi:hypothetical protein